MRMMPIIATLILAVTGTVVAQEDWTEFRSRDDHFTVTFPGTPKITETTWTTQFGAILPARIYSGTSGAGRFSITAVDYSPDERVLTERARLCPPGAETCQGIHDWGLGYWKNDIRGAVVYAISKYIKPDVTVTNMMANFADLVSGQELQLTNNKDQSRTFVSVYMHDNHLIVLEATVPKSYPPPTIIQQSLGWLDANGTQVRYQFIYHNEPDVPNPPARGR